MTSICLNICFFLHHFKQWCYTHRYHWGKLCSPSTEKIQEVFFHYYIPNPFFPPFHVFFFNLQELLSNDKSLSHRGAGKKTGEYATLVCFFWNHNKKQKKADKTVWPLYSPTGTKEKTFDWGSIFGNRQSTHCKSLCLHCCNAINTLKRFFFYNPTKNTGGLPLLGIVLFALFCFFFSSSATTYLLRLCTLQQVCEANHPCRALHAESHSNRKLCVPMRG